MRKFPTSTPVPIFTRKKVQEWYCASMTRVLTIVIMQLESIQTMNPIRVLIVDDQPAFRRHLRQLLTEAGLAVVGEAGDMLEARVLVRSLHPDLAVVDINLPGESGVSGTPQLLALAPKLRVILVSAYQDRAQVLRKSAMEAGAEAFVPKDDLELDIVKKWAEKADKRPDEVLMK